jgi:hypothetical protein
MIFNLANFPPHLSFGSERGSFYFGTIIINKAEQKPFNFPLLKLRSQIMDLGAKN